MTIRNIATITKTALALAVIAFAAPAAHAQNAGNSLLNSYYSNGTFYGYNPFAPGAFGVGPLRYYPSGPLVLGSNGQLYNPLLGDGVPEPTINADGITVPAPLVPMVAPIVPTVPAAPAPMSDQIDAVHLSGNRLRIEWTGDPRSVATLTFSLLDKKRTTLKSTILSDMPAQAFFTVPSNAAFYRVVITYNDGAMRSLVTGL